MRSIEEYFDGSSYYRIVEQRIDQYIGPERRDPAVDLLAEIGNAFAQILMDIYLTGDAIDELHLRVHLIHEDVSRRELQVIATTRRPFVPVSEEDRNAQQTLLPYLRQRD